MITYDLLIDIKYLAKPIKYLLIVKKLSRII